MKERVKIPPELREQIVAPFLVMFGGREKLDCWLSKTADLMADPKNPAIFPVNLDQKLFPAELQAWMSKPKEVVDHLLEQLDILSIFIYTAKFSKQEGCFRAVILDQETGHTIEEITSSDQHSLIASLTEKYGHNLEVVKE